MRTTRVAPVLLLTLAVTAGPVIAGSPGPKTRLVSKTSQGEPADGTNNQPSLSNNARFVAFESNADNLPGDDAWANVYLHDRATGKTRLVSRNSSGEPATGGSSSAPKVSGNGRFVVFQSFADNLPGGSGLPIRIYIHDRKTGRTTLVSKNSAGDPSNGTVPSVSDSGRYVAFQSQAANLPGANGDIHVYVRDRRTGRTRLVSKTSSGEVVLAGIGDLSGNGRIVSLRSGDALLPGSGIQVYVHDRRTGKTRLVSKTSQGDSLPGMISGSVLSGTGRFVAIEAQTFMGDVCDTAHVFVHDRKTGKTRLVTKTSGGQPAEGCSQRPSISSDGRFVVFDSDSDDLPGGGAPPLHAFVHDRLTGRTRLVSKSNSGAAIQGFDPAIDGDGSHVAFGANDDSLPGADGTLDTYVRGPL
jgi:Tol biopolymer transport system component